MRWLVEVSSLGKTDTQKFCVDAESWQRALQAARLQRGEEGPMSGFSIELLEEGYRAVDPLARVRFVVKRAPDDMPLTPGPEKNASATTFRGVAPASPSPAGSASPAGTMTAAKKSVPPPAATTTKSVPPPAVVATSPVIAAAASSLSADATIPNLPVAPSSSSPVPAAAQNGGVVVKKTPSVMPPRPVGGTNGASTASNVASPKATTISFGSNGEDKQDKPVERAAPPAIGSSIPGLPAVKLLSSREQNPSDASPLTYREYAFAVPAGTTEEQAADVLRAQLQYVEAHLATSKMGKLVNLACFDVEFTGKPPRAPIATLTWKDWKGDPVVAFPGQAGQGNAASKPPRPPSTAPASLEAGLAQGVAAVVIPQNAPLPNVGSSPSPPSGWGVPNSSSGGMAPAAASSSGAASTSSSRPPAAAMEAASPMVAAATAQAAAQQVAAEQAAREAAAQQAAAQRAAAEHAAREAAAQQAAAQQAAAEHAAREAAVREAAYRAEAARDAAQHAAQQQAAAQPAFPPPATAPAPVPAAYQPSSFPAPTAQPAPIFVEADPMKSVPNAAAAGNNMVRTPSGRFVRGRVAGDELITSLFESMHDLHFLRDALDGGQFCLALATEVLPARAALIHFFDLDKREWVVACTRGKETPRLLTTRAPEADEVLREAARRRRAVVIPNAETATGERYRQLGGSRSIIVAPIMQAGRALGALEIINPLDGMPFTEDEGNAMTYIAEQFAEYLGSRGIVLDKTRIQNAASR